MFLVSLIFFLLSYFGAFLFNYLHTLQQNWGPSVVLTKFSPLFLPLPPPPALFVAMMNYLLATRLPCLAIMYSAMIVGVCFSYITDYFMCINHTIDTHLSTKINEGEPEIHCPQYKCNIHVPDMFIKKIVSAAVFDKYLTTCSYFCIFFLIDLLRYLRFVTKNFVRENDKVRWCPTPGMDVLLFICGT